MFVTSTAMSPNVDKLTSMNNNLDKSRCWERNFKQSENSFKNCVYVVSLNLPSLLQSSTSKYRFESEILTGDPDDMENTILKWNTYFKDKIEDGFGGIKYLTIVNWKAV